MNSKVEQLIEEGAEEDNSLPETPPTELMPTLPNSFESLVGKPIKIDVEQPQVIIELLGDLLGVTDFRKNMVSFWFLDSVALQILRYKTQLDDFSRSILVSWLCGEIMMIRDRKLSRENFLETMDKIFHRTGSEVDAGSPLLHWDRLTIPENEESDEEMNENSVEISTRTNSEQRVSLSGENSRAEVPVEAEIIMKKGTLDKMEKVFVGSSTGDSKSSHLSVTLGKASACDVLKIIIDTTFDMFGTEFGYALIQAALTEKIQFNTYVLPFALRQLRPVKLIEIPEPKEKNREKDKRDNAKKVAGQKGKKKNIKTKIETPPSVETPPQLSEEEILRRKRMFILPLIEANEAPDILKMFEEIV